MKHIIVKTTQPTRFPVASVLVRACIILSTVALSLLLVSCPDEAQPGGGAHVPISPLYICRNGTAETGTTRTATEPPTELCIRCNFGYVIANATCVPQPTLSTATQITLPPAGSGTIVADFENPRALLDAGWVATEDFVNPININAWVGTSFPGSGAGFIGQRSFNSCQPDAGSTCPEIGRLISPPIPVTHRYLNFLIAGTPGVDRIAVIIQDSEDDIADFDDPTNHIARIQPLYTAPEYITSDFDWRSIDLESEMAETDSNIRIIIRDEREGSINVDHFFFSDQPWGLRQDQWSNTRPSFFGDSTVAIGDSTHLRLHTGGFDPATGQPTALFGGFDDAATLSTENGWEYSDGILAQDATAPATAALAGLFDSDAARGRIGANPISTCGITTPGRCTLSTGVTITSPAFPVTGRYLNFLLAGGGGSAAPGVALNGAAPVNTNLEFRLFAGDNDAAAASEAVLRMSPQRCDANLYGLDHGDETLWQSIDVSAYMNQTLRFQLIDNSQFNCQSITLDHMYFSDVPVSRSNIRGALVSASPDITPPGLITNLRALQGPDGSAQVDWTEPFDSDLLHTLLSWEPADGDQTSPLMVDAGTRTAAITGLTDGTEYSFTAVSVDTTGNMSAAAQPSVVTADDTTPATPTALAASAIANGGASLSWTNPPDTDDLFYTALTWSPADGDQTSPFRVRGDSATVTGLMHGTEYSFTIAAVDIAGNISDASAAQTATADSSVSPVTALTATAGNASIALSWTAPTDSDFASVTITWDPAGGTTNQPLSVATGTSAASITGLTNGTQYTVSVVAVDGVGNRSTVETATATPVAP